MSRGNNRQTLFEDPQDYETYLEKVRFYQKRYGFLLYAYVLMPNHTHLLMEVDRAPLSRIMQGLQQSYALYHNRRHGKIGHLFQGRYKAILCEKENYLLQLVRYIHCNPLRAGLVRDLRKYPWSSHLAYLKKPSDEMLAIEAILSRFSSKRQDALSRYRQYILEGREEGHRSDYYQTIEPSYLGSERFGKAVRKKVTAEEPKPFVEVGLKEIAKRVAGRMGVSIEGLREAGRRRNPALHRALIARLALEVAGISLKECARYFRRDPATLSILVWRLEERLREDRALANLIKIIEKDLRQGKRRKYKIINV